MSHPTLVSIFEYARIFDKPVRTEGSPPREVYHLEDAEHAIRLLSGEILGEQSIHSCLLPSLTRS